MTETPAPRASGRKILLWACVFVAVFLGGYFLVQSNTGGQWGEVAPPDLNGREQAQHQQAIAARDALMSGLLQRLQAALASGGSESAISVCKEAAPVVAREVAAAHDLRIGRTALRLRNPRNLGPLWTEAFVQAGAAEPAFSRGPGDELGVMFPILLMPQCVQCHGKPEEIEPATLARLRELYPEDQATGFEPGDLRGWFWVEVPARE